MKLKDLQLTTQVREVRGIVLPYTKERCEWDFCADPVTLVAVKEETGEVFVDVDTLIELAEQYEWDSQFGSPLLLGGFQAEALEQAGLAVQETRGGYHGTPKLRKLVKRLMPGAID